jgi:hypothetical protein
MSLSSLRVIELAEVVGFVALPRYTVGNQDARVRAEGVARGGDAAICGPVQEACLDLVPRDAAVERAPESALGCRGTVS